MELTPELGAQVGRDGVMIFLVVKMFLDFMKDKRDRDDRDRERESNTSKEPTTSIGEVLMQQTVRQLADNSIRQTEILGTLTTTVNRVEGKLEAIGECKFVPRNGAAGH